MREVEAALAPLLTVENPWRFDTVGAAEFAAVEAENDRHAHRAQLHELNRRLAAANEAAIRRADLVVAVLDGVDVDSGTASEIGFAYGLGKPVWGLRTDFRLAGDNLGSIVNLQVEYWIETSGGQIVTNLPALTEALQRLSGNESGLPTARRAGTSARPPS